MNGEKNHAPAEKGQGMEKSVLCAESTTGAVRLSGLILWNNALVTPADAPDTKIMTGTIQVCDDGTMCEAREIGNTC